MKIKSIESFSTTQVGLVRVTTDTGDQGWGQVSTYHADITCIILHRQVAPWVLGREVSDLSQLGDLFDLVFENAAPSAVSIPRCGIYTARSSKSRFANCSAVRRVRFVFMPPV